MKTKVGVFFGGRSVEHEISVISALQAINAIPTEQYDVIPVYISKQGRFYTGSELLNPKNYKDIAGLLGRSTEVYLRPELGNGKLYKAKAPLFGKDYVTELDVVFPVLHGTNGEDGNFQGLIELTGLPYVGCNTLSSANGMDKITMKMILRESGIPVIDYVWFTDKQWTKSRDEMIAAVEEKIGYPAIVKPANLGSSVGISPAADRAALIKAIETAKQYTTRIIVEHMVTELKEINCSVLGSSDDCEASVCEEPIKSGEILSYEDKYMGGSKGAASKGMQSTRRQIPADLPAETTAEIQRLACETFRVLSCEGVSRIDFIIDGANGEVYVNEINEIPGSLSFYLWEATGVSFAELTDRLIKQALRRKREQSLKTVSYDQNIFSLGGGIKGGIKK